METETGQQTNTGTAPTINTQELENPTPNVSLPEQPGVPSPFGIGQFLSTPNNGQAQQNEINQLQNQSDDLLGSLIGSFTDDSTQGARTLSAEEEAGIPQMQTELTVLQNEAKALADEYRLEIRRIEDASGMTMAQKNARINDVRRKQTRDLLDKQLLIEAKSNTLTNTQSIVQRKLDLQFADEQARLDGLKFIYNENKELLTDKQDKAFQERINRENRAFELAKSQFQTLETQKVDLIRNASANGASNSVLKAIQGANTVEEAYSAAGRFGLSFADQIARQNLANLVSESGGSNEDVRVAQETQDRINVIDSALNNKGGFRAAVGVNRFQRRALGRNAERLNFIADIEQITSQLTLDQLIQAKEQGATFGALSEKELQAIASAATKLGSFKTTNKRGDVILKASEADVEAELNKIRDLAIRDYELRTGLPYPEPPATEADYATQLLNGYSPFSQFAN